MEAALDSGNKDELESDVDILLECLKCQKKDVGETKRTLLALADVFSSTEEAKEYFRKVGGLLYVNMLMLKNSSEVVKQAAMCCLACAVENQVFCQNVLTKTETFSFLHGILKNVKSDSKFLSAAVFLFLQIVNGNSTGQRLAKESGVLGDLINIFRYCAEKCRIQNSDSVQGMEVLPTVITALSMCVNNPQNEVNQRLCSSLLPLCLQVVSEDKHKQLSSSLLSFAGLTIAGNSFNQNRVRTCGGLSKLLVLLQGCQKLAGQDMTLLNIAIAVVNVLDAAITDHEVNRQAFVKGGGVQAVMSLLHLPQQLSTSNLLQLLLTLGHALDTEEKTVLTSADQRVLVRLLTDTDDEEVVRAVKFVLNTLHTTEEIQDHNDGTAVENLKETTLERMKRLSSKLASVLQGDDDDDDAFDETGPPVDDSEELSVPKDARVPEATHLPLPSQQPVGKQHPAKQPVWKQQPTQQPAWKQHPPQQSIWKHQQQPSTSIQSVPTSQIKRTGHIADTANARQLNTHFQGTSTENTLRQQSPEQLAVQQLEIGFPSLQAPHGNAQQTTQEFQAGLCVQSTGCQSLHQDGEYQPFRPDLHFGRSQQNTESQHQLDSCVGRSLLNAQSQEFHPDSRFVNLQRNKEYLGPASGSQYQMSAEETSRGVYSACQQDFHSRFLPGQICTNMNTLTAFSDCPRNTQTASGELAIQRNSNIVQFDQQNFTCPQSTQSQSAHQQRPSAFTAPALQTGLHPSCPQFSSPTQIEYARQMAVLCSDQPFQNAQNVECTDKVNNQSLQNAQNVEYAHRCSVRFSQPSGYLSTNSSVVNQQEPQSYDLQSQPQSEQHRGTCSLDLRSPPQSSFQPIQPFTVIHSAPHNPVCLSSHEAVYCPTHRSISERADLMNASHAYPTRPESGDGIYSPGLESAVVPTSRSESLANSARPELLVTHTSRPETLARPKSVPRTARPESVTYSTRPKSVTHSLRQESAIHETCAMPDPAVLTGDKQEGAAFHHFKKFMSAFTGFGSSSADAAMNDGGDSIPTESVTNRRDSREEGRERNVGEVVGGQISACMSQVDGKPIDVQCLPHDVQVRDIGNCPCEDPHCNCEKRACIINNERAMSGSCSVSGSCRSDCSCSPEPRDVEDEKCDSRDVEDEGCCLITAQRQHTQNKTDVLSNTVCENATKNQVDKEGTSKTVCGKATQNQQVKGDTSRNQRTRDSEFRVPLPQKQTKSHEHDFCFKTPEPRCALPRERSALLKDQCTTPVERSTRPSLPALTPMRKGLRRAPSLTPCFSTPTLSQLGKSFHSTPISTPLQQSRSVSMAAIHDSAKHQRERLLASKQNLYQRGKIGAQSRQGFDSRFQRTPSFPPRPWTPVTGYRSISVPPSPAASEFDCALLKAAADNTAIRNQWKTSRQLSANLHASVLPRQNPPHRTQLYVCQKSPSATCNSKTVSRSKAENSRSLADHSRSTDNSLHFGPGGSRSQSCGWLNNDVVPSSDASNDGDTTEDERQSVRMCDYNDSDDEECGDDNRSYVSQSSADVSEVYSMVLDTETLQQREKMDSDQKPEPCPGCTATDLNSRTFNIAVEMGAGSCTIHRNIRQLERDFILTRAWKSPLSKLAYRQWKEAKRKEENKKKKERTQAQQNSDQDGSKKKKSVFDFSSSSSDKERVSPPRYEPIPVPKAVKPPASKRGVDQGRRRRVPYSSSEVHNLVRGVQQMGKHWQQILNTFPFHPSRTAVDLKEKYKRIKKQAEARHDKTNKERSRKAPLSMCEERRLRRGVAKFGHNWTAILHTGRFAPGRTGEELRDRWRILEKH